MISLTFIQKTNPVRIKLCYNKIEHMFGSRGGETISNIVYKTLQIEIKKGHRLFPYFEQMCQDAKHLFNTANFYIRQVFTAFRLEKPLQPLQQEVLDTLNRYIEVMNERQLQAYQSRVAKEQLKAVEERQEIRCNQFELPSEESPWIDYHFLDAYSKSWSNRITGRCRHKAASG